MITEQPNQEKIRTLGENFQVFDNIRSRHYQTFGDKRKI